MEYTKVIRAAKMGQVQLVSRPVKQEQAFSLVSLRDH